MSKAKRKRLEKEAAKQAAEIQATENVWQARRVIIIVSIIFIALIAIIIGVNHYFSENQKYLRINAISIDDETVGMDYFLRRCYASGSDPMSVLSGITKELVLKKEAESLGWEISEQEIDNKLIEIAQGDSESITQSEYKEWLRQRLNESKLTEDEYRDITATSIIAEAFYDIVAEATPTTAEQVHLHVILLDTEEDALEVKARLEAGEDFAELAKERSLEGLSREEGGDIGWIPRGVIYESRLDEIAFNLEPEVISEPLANFDTSVTDPSSPSYVNYFIIKVTEKSDSREIDEKYLENVWNNAYEEWIGQMLSQHDIKYHGIRNGYDSETYSWMNWQLQKMTGEK